MSTSLLNQRQRNRSVINTSLERLSTGKRINHAKDDPSGLIAAEGFRSKITDLQAQYKTSRLGELNLRQQESQLSVIQNGLNELRGAVVSTTGDLFNPTQKQALQQTVDATLESFDRLAPGLAPASLDALGHSGNANLVNGDTALANQIIDGALQSVLGDRSANAANSLYSDIEQELIQDQIVINTEALSQVEDADFAEEASNLVRGQILEQASTMALAYSLQSHAETIGDLLDRTVATGQSISQKRV
ncbi:flagellin [Botrimarina colliarenosi]|uniref:flagellin n=1 Tax=Botrimarina colliarenosi TaxID=2528001 RepID=UPI0018D43584|nr:flagellin [Botrimarina colliarenosi]